MRSITAVKLFHWKRYWRHQKLLDISSPLCHWNHQVFYDTIKCKRIIYLCVPISPRHSFIYACNARKDDNSLTIHKLSLMPFLILHNACCVCYLFQLQQREMFFVCNNILNGIWHCLCLLHKRLFNNSSINNPIILQCAKACKKKKKSWLLRAKNKAWL